MLELNYYSVQEIQNLKDFFLVSYVVIDDIYHRIIPDTIRFRRNYSKSKLSDSEIITIAIVGEIHDTFAQELKTEKGITLLALKRNNSKKPYPKNLRNWISKHRRRIETIFSQLAEQFHINEVLANSLSGLKARIQSKILGHNISYFMNKCLGNQATGQITHLIFR